MKLRTALFCGLLMATSFGACTAATQIAKVSIKSQAQVQPGSNVTLGDIANISAGAALGQRIAGISLSNSPMPGRSRSISAGYVKVRLSAVGLKNVTVAGASEVVVTGKSTNIEPEMITDQAKAFLLEQLPQDNRIYEISIERTPKAIVTALCSDYQLRCRMLSTAPKTGINTVAVDVVNDSQTVATCNVAMRVKAVAEVLTAKTAIKQGEELTTENTAVMKRDISGSDNVITEIQDSSGTPRVARRSIAPGTSIISTDVTTAPAIKQGENVNLVVACGSVRISTTAQARENGRIGDSIRVKPEASSQDIRAMVVEAGLVEIRR